jgi:hypothetical protein
MVSWKFILSFNSRPFGLMILKINFKLTDDQGVIYVEIQKYLKKYVQVYLEQ